ncbi:hypothetical protein ORV05_35495 [Amycolatopsis cynarae]|uniref:Choice-of-anchor G family protein n=1 Tax=Amycolatopsis cynarae TaxID=2995223 RepID=A0ABY7B330_9PSEU|nr:hypothetical protein [Amycolatopsis sp. HUAS 11-8]WAL66093.1 hypothetical protein ORV05_35495 [Amycolatopsis sp. HUAS 11-8]
MRRRLPRALALPVTAALFVLSATPAMADTTIPTTPPLQPVDPSQAPVSAPDGPQPLGHAVGDAAASLGVLRLLPNSVPTSSIMPGYGRQLPKQAALEAGMGLSSAQANSEASLSYERSIAQSSPLGLAVAGNAPQTPGGVVQTALPDNEKAVTGGLTAPQNPLLNVGLLNGSAHARWSPTLGPCVGAPMADASTSVASISLLNALSSVPNLPLTGLSLPQGTQLAKGFDPSQGLQALGGLLGGTGQTSADGTGALLNVPNLLSSRSVVQLVDLPNSKNKAVQSVSTLQAADIQLLKGTPLELTLKVVSQPTLKVTSTGDKATSTVEYTAPVITIERQGKVLYTLDAAHPTKDIPIGLPLAGLSDKFGDVSSLPVVGGLVSTLSKGLQQLNDTAGLVLDLGVLRLSIAELNQNGQQLATPFAGYQLGASARLLDLQVLPTTALKNVLPKSAADALPSSLAQISLGEQIARAYTPTGGVVCGSTTPTTAPVGNAAPGAPAKLAYTSGAYSAVPLFWSGTAMLLLGVVLVAAVPNRRRRQPAVVKPSPRPRAD